MQKFGLRHRKNEWLIEGKIAAVKLDRLVP